MSATCLKSIRLLAFLGGLALIVTGECQPLFVGVFISFLLLGFKVEKLPRLAWFFGVAQQGGIINHESLPFPHAPSSQPSLE